MSGGKEVWRRDPPKNLSLRSGISKEKLWKGRDPEKWCGVGKEKVEKGPP